MKLLPSSSEKVGREPWCLCPGFRCQLRMWKGGGYRDEPAFFSFLLQHVSPQNPCFRWSEGPQWGRTPAHHHYHPRGRTHRDLQVDPQGGPGIDGGSTWLGLFPTPQPFWMGCGVCQRELTVRTSPPRLPCLSRGFLDWRHGHCHFTFWPQLLGEDSTATKVLCMITKSLVWHVFCDHC